MRYSLLSLALAGLLAFAHASRAESPREADKSFEPTALLRLAPIDDLLADVRYLAKMAQRDENFAQIETVLKKVAGDKGPRGIDSKKPLGAYATLGAKIDQSQLMILLPVTDEQEFLGLLKDVGVNAEKGDDGVYKARTGIVPFAILFRFAHGYAYATLEMTSKTTVPEAGKLPKPEAVFAAKGPAVSLKVEIDRIPQQLRKLGVSAAALHLGNMMEDEVKGETQKQKEFRGALLDQASALVKQLIEEGGSVSLDLGVDHKQHDLSVSLKVAGKPDTDLAKTLVALGQTKSLAGLIGKDSALGGFLSFSLPKDALEPLGKVVDESVEIGLELIDENLGKLVKPLVEALALTAKSGSADVALDLRGPSKNGKYTVVAGVRVKDGDKIEEALKKAIDGLPEVSKKTFGLDVAKVEGVNVHRVEQTNVDKRAKDLFGDGPVYFAVSKDLLIITVGEDALETSKSVLTTKPKAGSFQFEASLSRLAPLLVSQRKNAVEAAKSAFVQKESDKVTVSVKGGKALEVKVSVKTPVLTFAAKLDQEKKQDAESEEDR